MSLLTYFMRRRATGLPATHLIGRWQSRQQDYDLDAAGNVTLWRGSAAQPLLLHAAGAGTTQLQLVNGLPYVRLQNAWFGSPGILPHGSYTIFLIVQRLAPPPSTQIIIGSLANDFYVAALGDGRLVYSQGDAGIVAPGPPTGQKYIIQLDYDDTSGTATMLLNNAVAGSASGGAGIKATYQLQLGTFAGGALIATDTLLGELLIFDAQLSAADRQQWYTYLLTR